MQKNRFTARRIALNAVMAALFVALSMVSFIIAGVKITLEGLPVVICAVVFGPVDAAIVGGLGKFLNQMLTYGLTPTTVLWILPAVVQGLATGIGVVVLRKLLSNHRFETKGYSIGVLTVSAVGGMLAAVLNTVAYYVDSKMFGYYDYYLVLGVFWIRLALNAGLGVLMGSVGMSITQVLKRARLI